MTPRAPASPSDPTPLAGMLTALCLSLGVAVSNGLARFAYALVLPSMRNDLGWSYTEAGWNNSANALGYLVGAIVAFRIARQSSPRALFIGAQVVLAVAIFATGLTADFWLLAALRFLGGLSGAVSFIAGSVLAANVFPNDVRRSAASISVYFAGGGVALLASGATLPIFLAHAGDAAWPYAWIGMGLFSALITIVVTLAARRVADPELKSGSAVWIKRPFVPLLIGYGSFGLGYIAYMTFIIARMREGGSSAAELALFWSVLGIATFVAPPLWQRPLTRWPGGKPLALVLLALGIGAGLPALSTSLPLMLASAIVFGSAFFVAPTSVTAFARKSLPPTQWAEAIAGFTIVFAVCQCVGPVLSGLLSDLSGSLAVGLGASAAVLLAGSLVALRQPELPRPR